MNRRLYRSRTDAPWTGVAGGVAEWLRIDPSLVRVAWVVLALLTAGMAALVYLVMWAVVPEEPAATDPPTGTTASAAVAPRTRAGQTKAVTTTAAAPPATEADKEGSGALVAGLILIGVGVFFLAQQYLPAFEWGRVWPIVLVIVGAVVLVTSYRRGDRAS